MSFRLSLVIATAIAVVFCFACDKGPEPAAAASASPVEATPPIAGKVYGDGVHEAQSVAISEIVDHPERFDGKKVRVEGLVTDVCPRRGCWFDMAGDKPGKTMRFKVQDGVMVFPATEKGKHAVAEGVVKVQKLSLEETRQHAAHEAEEKGETFDPESITEPTVAVRIDGTGAAIRANK